MAAWYNEIDPYCCEWLKNLMAAGLLPKGEVDGRDIRDVEPRDLAGFDQCHFFAGLGGWPYALRLAGWPDDRPVWTGSCPCQPFSLAGRRQGFDDPRDLWPCWRALIAQCRPPVVFGEQTARAAAWQARLHRDLEALDYAVGAMPIEAASLGAWHLRDRFWFVADTLGGELRDEPGGCCRPHRDGAAEPRIDGAQRLVADVDEPRLEVVLAGEAGQLPPPVGAHPWTAEPAVGRVVYGAPARVDQIRAFGNAIVPQVAQEFIQAYLACRP